MSRKELTKTFMMVLNCNKKTFRALVAMFFTNLFSALRVKFCKIGICLDANCDYFLPT